MTTHDIADLCKRLDILHEWQDSPRDRETITLSKSTLERQAAENKRLRLALAEAGMRIETCPGAYKSHVEIIVQKIQAALTGEDTAGSPTSENTEPGLAFSDAGEP